MITVNQERSFYDARYAAFLSAPDHAMRMDRHILTGLIENPAHPQYERRRLYHATMRALELAGLPGARVLDYGCGTAEFGVWMATEGAHVTLLDLSAKAIEVGLKRAAASGVEVRGVAADASCLDMFEAGEFDLVFGCAALHHTMKYPGAVAELARVMRPGARLVLCESWGGNPLLNAARRLRAKLSGEQEEQGEDIILSTGWLRVLAPFFEDVRPDTMNLLAMGKRLLRGRFERPWARAAVRTLERVDAALLAIAPPLRGWCGEAVITARRGQS